MRSLRSMLILAATLSLAACVEIFGPDAVGVYGLTTANETSVPSVVFSKTGTNGFDVSLVSGILRLRHDDTFTLQLDYVERDAQSNTYYSQSVSGDWSENDNFVRLEYVDPATGDWHSLGGFERYRGLELTLPVSNYGVNVRTVFER
jgi:hypothetical protein